MNELQQNPSEVLCSRCGEMANWRFLDQEKQTIEIVCPDCGRFEVPRAELELAEFDIVDAAERRE